jgi:hypothetical protein
LASDPFSFECPSYRIIIQLAVLFGSETWTLTEKSTAALVSWEMKVSRRIYGPVSINGTWRIRTNRELENVYNISDILTEIKPRRTEWLGHILRMESSRVPQTILDGRPQGEKKHWETGLKMAG